MKQCPLIEDLLPLYIDDAVSPESRALVEAHLATCPDCQLALEALQAGPPALGPTEPAQPSDDARFLTRLKRRVGSIIGMSLMLLLVTAFGANQYGRWRTDKEWAQRAESRAQDEKAAVAAIREASPDPMARLKAHGVDLTYEAKREGDGLRMQYTITSTPPVAWVIAAAYPGQQSPRLLDPATGKELGRFRQGGSQLGPDRPTTGDMYFDAVTGSPANAEFPSMQIYIKPQSDLAWEVQRPGEEGDVLLGHRFTVGGVEFEVERVRFAGDQVHIDYRQLTPAKEVGLHFLSFRLSDRMGGNWGGDPRLDRLPDPLRPSQTFDFVASLSKHWSVKVEHAVLALPGPTVPVEVK